MTIDEIPDDVVERALDAFDADWRLGSSLLPQAMRAAGRVFVEWEREQCARVADDKADGVAASHYATASSAVCSHDMAKTIATAIRSRKA